MTYNTKCRVCGFITSYYQISMTGGNENMTRLRLHVLYIFIIQMRYESAYAKTMLKTAIYNKHRISVDDVDI